MKATEDKVALAFGLAAMNLNVAAGLLEGAGERELAAQVEKLRRWVGDLYLRRIGHPLA